MEVDVDSAVRTAAFRFLDEHVQLHGEVLPREVLHRGFDFRGQRVPLVGPQGIFKPAVLREVPLTITTVPVEMGRTRPYDDQLGEGGQLLYRYRGTDPRHRDNEGLRAAMRRQTPLIYLYGVVPGQYMPVWPVFIVGDDPAALSFRVAVDEAARVAPIEGAEAGMVADIRRRYVTAVTQRRLHQQTFRQRVLRAYQERCAICRLRHAELLDAAHILPDSHPRGEPTVPNGLALCSLHHTAFDRNVIGVRPDLVVEVRRDVLEESDGPMLRHGLQGFHRKTLFVPRPEALRPNAEFLAERYELFLGAG
jgi:putative restriction endonuclease